MQQIPTRLFGSVFPDVIAFILPNRFVRDSEASKNSVVETALLFASSTGTSAKDLGRVSKKLAMIKCMT
jgi:hypothetical protein